MNVKVLRAIDKYGIGAVTALAGPFVKILSSSKEPPAIRRVLLIKLWAIGDSVLTLPLIHAIRNRFPDSEIDVLCHPSNRPVFANAGTSVSNVHELNARNLAGMFRRYDLCFDTEPYLNLSSLLAAYSAGWREEEVQVPEGRYYHLGHSWAIPEANQQTVKIGIDDFAQKLVGGINGIQVPALGSTLRQGDRGWTLKIDSKTIDMLSPVGGRAVAINEKVIQSPAAINQDPYNNWLMEVEAPKFSVEKRQLLSGGLAKKWMEEVRESLLSRMNYNLGLVYQDGGLLVDGMA